MAITLPIKRGPFEDESVDKQFTDLIDKVSRGLKSLDERKAVVFGTAKKNTAKEGVFHVEVDDTDTTKKRLVIKLAGKLYKITMVEI